MLPRLASLAPAGPALRRWRRLLRRRRRPLSALLAAATLLTVLHSVAPAPPATSPLLVASRDLPGGVVLTSADVAVARVPPSAVPAGVLPADAVEGRTLAAPVRRGEPLTDVRLLGPGLVGALAEGLVAAPVRIADASVGALVHAGDLLDILAAPADPSTPRATTIVAAAVRVLAVPAPVDGGTVGSDGALIVVATTRAQASALATAATGDRLSVSLLRG
jgi:pilus assembly protein CpaB